jgi:hypothetical protein
MSFIQNADFPIPGESAICVDYKFNASQGKITVNESDLTGVLLVINLADGQVIFNPTKPALTGDLRGNALYLTLDTSTMDDGDPLLIIASVDRHSAQERLLIEVRNELKELNFILRGIAEQ